MGTLKRIGSTGQAGSREQTTGGRLRRIDTGETITYNPDPVRSLPNVDKITGNATQQDRSAVQTASGTLRKAGRPTSAGKLVRITSPEREAESRAEELRTLRDEAHQEFLNFRGAEITAGATGMPTEPYAGQRYRTAEEAYQAWQDYDRQYAEFRNQYYQEENERQQARLAGDTAMQASFARADEIRAALNRIQSLEQTRAAAPGPMTEDAVSQALQEIVGQYGLSQEDGRDLTTARKALEAQLLDETDRLSAAGYDYERMTEYQRRQQTAAEAEQQRQQTAAWAEEHPVLASIASVAAAPLQAIDIPRLIASGGGNEDDLRTYTPADPNSALVTGFVTTVRDTVSKQIEENTDWDLFGQNVASFLYNTGLSVGDSALQVGLLGPWATYLMGASAASQQAVNVLERGGSNTQAFWGGLAAGAAEAVFEKFSVDRLLRARSVNSVKDLLRETAKQAGTEASEEMLTEVANILSDTAIMGESSDFEQLVTQYQLMGMGEDEARKQAYLDSLSQVVWAGVGGALSGAAMGGGLGGVDLAGRAVQQRQQQTTSRAIDDAYATMQREGLFSPAARQAAGQAQQRIDEADRREARAFNNNYYGQPRLPELRLAQEQNQEQPAEQRPQDAPAAVNVAELEQSAAAAGAAEADTRAAAEISQALGREIRFYDGAQRQDPSARANGYFDGDTIYVNSRSANPVAQIISHELTHSVELADAYQDLSSLVFDRIQRTGGDLEQLRQEKQALYAANGVSLASQEMIDQEIVAEYVEQNLLTNEQEILDLTRENPTLGQRILDWIDRILARLGNSSAQERAFLTTARDTYARALEQTRTSQEAGQQQSTQQTAPPAAQTAPAGQRTERQTEPQEQGQEAAPRQQEARPEPEAEPAAPEADQERQRRREEIRQEVRTLREDYAAGRISDEEFDEALDAIMEEEGLEDVSMLGRYSFGGQNARRADLEALDRAKEMERQGVAMETIFRETGWYTGADGKWRFEIDDSGMEYSRWGDLNRSDRAEYARFRELEGKFIDGSITMEEQNELRQLIDQGHGPGRAEEQQTLQLSDFVRHDELYQNYPQLRQAGLRFADLPGETHGSYNTGTNTITLNSSLRDAPEDTLVHEIQHAIQNAEGFAGGSSPEYWERARIDAETAASAARENLRLWLQDIGYQDYVRQSMDRVVAGEITLDQHWENLQRFKENSDRAREIAVSEEEVARYEERLREIDQMGMTARELYQNTAGEIEARDVTARRQLTPEQRRQTMPNTGDENTVFADNFGNSFSAEEAEPVDSQAFKDWFGDWTSDRADHSQVVDGQGRPLIVYHGTGTSIEEFLPEFTGQGNDQYGSGFYFTTDRETAEGYTTRTLNNQSKPGGMDNPNVIPAYLNIRNPLVVEARDTPNLYQIEVPASQAAKIIGKMPDIMDPETSILGDFFDDYWESGPKRSMINRLAREYDWTLGTLATDIFRDHPTEFRQAVSDVLGYDGVQVNFPSGEKHFIAWFPNQIKHATENSGAFSPNDNRIRYSMSEPADAQQHPQGARRIRKTAEPSTAAQDEADRLFFQGVDADTIREMTGLERTEDGDWRIAVDTAPPAAYDGGRTTEQQGGRDDGQNEYDLRGIHGEDVRREAEEGYTGRAGRSRAGDGRNSSEDEGERRTAPASWARGRVTDRPSPAAGIAAENAGRYGTDTFVVEDAAIKERNPSAWALTSGGSIYISDSIPTELADVVGYHEAVHAARQRSQEQYRDFLDRTGDYIALQSNRAKQVLNVILESRFTGRNLTSLNSAERERAFDELNAVVWGFHKADPENARAQFADMFQDYDAYIADLDAAMESGAAADGDVRYSMDEDTQAEPSGNPLPSPDQDETQGTEQSYFDTLPRKVRNYLEGTERRLLNQLGDSLSVPRTARREYLKGITRQLTEEYLQQGRVSQETIDRLFDEAYKESKDAIRSYYNENQNLRDYLRSTKVEFSQEDVAEIPNLNDIAGRNAGILNISTESQSNNIDQVYQELSERWPGIFNTWWTTTARAKLRRIVEVARSFQIAEKTLNNYYGDQAADYRTWAKNDFEAAVTASLADLRNAKRYVEGRPAEGTSQAPTTMDEVAKLWTDLKDSRRTYERAAARNLLTDHDEVQVGRLLRGETELQYLDPDTENVRGITEVYQAKQEYERISRLLRQWNQSRKAGLRSQAEQLLQTANEWKDKKSGILYARETMERNIRDIVPDEQLADQIIETYFAPVHRAAADANRLKNRYRDQVRSMNLSRNVAEGNTVSEAHAVQLLGEAEDNIRMIQQSRGRRRVRDGKTLEEWQAVVNDLWAENPNLDQQKIRSAVAEFRTIYDELFQQMNDTRIRNGYEPVNYRQGYFPHFQPGDGDGIMAQFGRALGIGTEVTALPTTINGMTHAFRPGIRWFGNAQERLGFNTAYDAVEGFDRYIEGVADVIYQTDNIQRLRALATEIRYRTGDEGIRKQIDRIRDDPSLDDEDKRNRIEKIVEDGRFALSNFVVDLDEYTNLLANKKSRADRDMEQRLGRGAYNVVRALESRVAANMVAINPASWLTNFIPLTQGGALLDRGYLLRGMWETLQAYKESDGLVERSAFLTNRRGSDPILSVYEQGAEPTNRAARRLRNASIAAGRIGDVLSSPMSYIDNFTADSLVRARYRQNLAKGMSDDAALADADAFAASVMADRSKGATPTMFSRTNPVSKLFTQFQLEVNNQLSYVFKDIPRERRNMGVRALAAALLKFALGAWLYDEVYEFLIGRRPALDPIGILNDTVGDLTGWEVPNLVELGVGAATGDAPSWQVERQGLYDTLANLGTAAAEELPFIGGLLGGGRLPIGSAIPDFATLARAATDDEWDPSKRIAEAWDELQKPLTYLATPFGGGQLKRIYEAIDAVRRGGVYSLDAEGEEQLQYPVYNDTWQQAVANALLGSVFGTTALGTGRDWVESGFDTLGARQTAAYQGMVDAGVPGEDAYALLQDLQGLSAQEERQTLRESAVSGAGKSVVYYGLMASDKEKALMDALTDMDADMGEVTETLMAMKDAGMATGLAASNGRRSALQEAALTDEQKIQIYREMISDSRDDDIQSFQDAGMTFDQFLEAQMNYAFMEEEYDQYGNPTVEFHRWVDEQNLTDEQKATVKEAFQYYSQIPQSAGYYDKLTAAGLPEEEAYLLNQELDALEPEDGADSVSSLQRQQTVVNSGISQTDQLAALGTMMSEPEFGKVQAGTAYGVTPKAYVDLKAALPRYDSDGNGSFNQAEVAAAINSLGGLGGGLSNSQKAALWQLYNKSWSAKNNPFSVSIGQQVHDALNQDEEAGGLPTLGRTSDDLPGLSLPSLD